MSSGSSRNLVTTLSARLNSFKSSSPKTTSPGEKERSSDGAPVAIRDFSYGPAATSRAASNSLAIVNAVNTLFITSRRSSELPIFSNTLFASRANLRACRKSPSRTNISTILPRAIHFSYGLVATSKAASKSPTIVNAVDTLFITSRRSFKSPAFSNTLFASRANLRACRKSPSRTNISTILPRAIHFSYGPAATSRAASNSLAIVNAADTFPITSRRSFKSPAFSNTLFASKANSRACCKSPSRTKTTVFCIRN